MGWRESALEDLVAKSEFWKGKKVLVTGHTGFKGSWLSLWLQAMGAEVSGIALSPPTQPSLFEEASVADGMTSFIGDIRDQEIVRDVFSKTEPEVVFHLAAQPLVRYSYQDPVETYGTNVMGTLHILEAIKEVGSVRAAVMVTTDKCYENKEWEWGYRENEPMGGYDPYSSSKGCAELLISSYRNSFFPEDSYSTHRTAIASGRAGNVIGGGDWAMDRLIPDIIRGFQAQEEVYIRNPNAIRPWQHVLEPLMGYLQLAEKLFENGIPYTDGWNFGPHDADAKPVEWIVRQMAAEWPQDVKWKVDAGEHPHEATYLKLDCSKAKQRLQWEPRWNLSKALKMIVRWHTLEAQGGDLKDECLNQINDYLSVKDDTYESS